MARKTSGRFLLQKMFTDTSWSKIVKEQHIRFVVKQDNIVFTGIGFNIAEKFYFLQMKKPVDLVYTIDENEWNGETTLQLKVIDFRLSENYTQLNRKLDNEIDLLYQVLVFYRNQLEFPACIFHNLP